MTKSRRKFDREFKLRAVEMSLHRDNIKELAKELNVRPELIYRWRSEFASNDKSSFPGNGRKQMDDEESEVARLQKALTEMRMERDILKKAVGIFSKSDGRSFNL